MIDETGESSASRRALRLHLQSSLSTVALLSSFEAATACGTVQPERAETPLSAFGPTIKNRELNHLKHLSCHPPGCTRFYAPHLSLAFFKTCFALRTTIATLFLASN